MATRTRLRGAAAGDDEAPALQVPRNLPGAPVRRRRPAPGGGLHGRAVRGVPEGAAKISERLGSGAIDVTQWYFSASWKRSTRRRLSCSCPASTWVVRSSSRRTGSGGSPTSRGRPSPWPVGGPQTWFIVAILRNVGLDHTRTCVSSSIPPPSRSAPRGGQDRRVHGWSADHAGASGAEDRARRPRHEHGPAVVSVLLLHGRGEQGVRSQAPGSDKARAAGDPEGRSDLRARARARRSRHRRSGVHEELRLRPPGDEGIPYGKWRQYDPEDTVRFYALRLREAGVIKSSPQKIIAQGTDWRFLNELKKELKG